MKSVQLIKVFIASPGDVGAQRDEVERLIWNWNNEHTDAINVILMPIRWENNSIASYAIDKDGQAVINEQILKSSDILIAIFGNRIGARTNEYESGTIEEINVFHNYHSRGVGIFFLDTDTPEHLIEERLRVVEYKNSLIQNCQGLYGIYSPQRIQHFITKQVHELSGNYTEDTNKDSIYKEKQILNEDIFNDMKFDYDEQLFFLFIIENEIRNFGARWKAKETLEYVENWELENNLQNYLSSRYESVLTKLEQRDLVSVIEYTGPGNPRLYEISDRDYLDLKKTIRDNQSLIQELKSQFAIQNNSILFDPDFPF